MVFEELLDCDPGPSKPSGPTPMSHFIMRICCQIIRYTWCRRFREILIHPKIKRLCLPTWKQVKGGRKKKILLSHCILSHGGNVLFIYPCLNALEWGRLHFVPADASDAKVSHFLHSEPLTHGGCRCPCTDTVSETGCSGAAKYNSSLGCTAQDASHLESKTASGTK